MQNRQCKRNFLKAVDDLAHHIRTLVAKEQAREHLHLKVGSQFGLAQALLYIAQNIVGITIQVFKRAFEVKVTNHAHNHFMQIVLTRVPCFVGGFGIRFGVFNVLGADCRSHKNKIVLKITAVQYFGGDRIKKSFCQFGLKVVHQQTDVVQFHLLPHFAGLFTRSVFGF